MDEQFLQEIRRQEQLLDESGIASPEVEIEGGPKESDEGNVEVTAVPPETEKEDAPPAPVEENIEPAVAPPEGQRTLFGGDV